MKKIKLLLLSGLLFFSIVSCSTLLDEVNLREPTADAYFNTKQGFVDLINSCYVQMRTQLRGNQFGLMELGTDLWENASDVGVIEFNTYSGVLNDGNSSVYHLWSNYYLGITACNTAINRAQNPVTGMSQAEVNAKVAEAHLLRAWYYSILVMNFGDLPLVTEEVSSVLTTAMRSPAEDVFKLIFSDLQFAETYLPKTQTDYSRANQAVAKALLARIHLWHKDYSLAEKYAKEVINGGYGYALVPTYAELWDRDNTKNDEIILAIGFSTNPRLNDPYNELILYFTPRYDLNPGMQRSLIYSRPWPRFMATKKYLELLNSERWRDSRYEAVWLEYYMANNPATLSQAPLRPLQIGDTAVAHLPYAVTSEFRASKNYRIYDINDNFLEDGRSTGRLEQFVSMTKYHDKLRDAINSGVGTRDAFEIRFAEMYMIAAEALIMQNKPNEALPFVNVIRTRAAKPGREADMQATLADMNIDYILRERALEFGGERYRWIDLKRTGKLIEYAKEWNPPVREFMQERHLLRPIPRSFIDRLTNKEEYLQNGGQNPGY